MQQIELYTAMAEAIVMVKEFLSVKQLDYVEYNVEENPEARHRMISKSSDRYSDSDCR